MKPWIKFSTGIHRDRKIWKLSKDAQLVFFHLLSIAGSEENDNGILPPFEDISLELWFLKYSDNALRKIIAELSASGIIEIDADGIISLKNFTKWQTSEKTKSEINREYYLKNKAENDKFSEENTENSDKIQKKFRKNSDSIQKKFSMNSEKIQKNSDEIQTLDIDKDIDKDIDIEKEKENVICANAQMSEIQHNEKIQNSEIQKNSAKQNSEKRKKEKLTPDQHEYWQFAKENAEMAEAFYKATKIAPSGKEFGRWVNDLRELAEAGITVEDMQKGVDYMHGQGITIGAPGSVLKTARWLKVNPQVAKATQRESWTELAKRMSSERNGNTFGFGNSLPEGGVIDL